VELERLSVQLRPRGGWEALDLGFQMARAWWRPLWGVWLAVYLPIAAALHVAFVDRLWIAVMLLWWLKPVFDRFALQVVSRAVFGAPPTVGEALGAWRDILWPGLVSGLTLYRLHPARSAVLAVWQLEKQSGSQGKRRRDVLARRMTGSWTATGMCALFEAIIFLSLAVVGALLLPAGADTPADLADFFRGGGSEWQWDWLDSLCYVFAVSVVEPLYVAAGFSLYLNRRAILEGWDIELQLRRLDERLSAARPGLAAAVVLALAIGWLAVPQPQAVAAEQSAKEAIKEVLAAPEFQQYREVRRWKYRGERKEAAAEGADFWQRVGLLLSNLSRAALWIAVGVGIIALALIAGRYLPRFFEEKMPVYRPPDALFGLAVTPESLPADVAADAAMLARQGKVREALSLLYRGALSVLVHRDRVALAEGDTEGDCLRAARKALPDSAGNYFAQLVTTWIAAAYAGRLPEATAAEALARDWMPHFAARVAQPQA